MLTSKKKIFSMFIIIFVSLILFLSFNSTSFAIVAQTTDFYVNDSANIIDENNEEYIISTNKELYNKTGAQIVVVSVNNLEGKSIEDYATELFRSYGIGDKNKNNGVLFIVSIEERKTRIEVGYGLEGCITDGKSGRILDNYVIPYFKIDNWNEGIINGYNAILNEITNEYNISIDGANVPINTEEYDEFSEEDDVKYITAIIVFIVCLISRHIFSSNFIVKWIVGERNWSIGYYY